MELTEEQLSIITSTVLLSDIKEYINSHQKEYNEFLEKRKNQL